MNKKMLIIFAILLTPILAFSTYGNIGTAGYTFLSIDGSVTAGGMGGAYTAVMGSAEGLAYNVATIGSIEKSSLGFTYMNWLLDESSINDLQLVLPILPELVIGIRWKLMNYPGIKKYNESGFFTREEFVPSDNMIELSFATKFGENIYLGAGFGTIREEIDNHSSSATYINLGLTYKMEGLCAGISTRYIPIIENEMDEEDVPLPTTFRLGVSYQAMEELLVALDVEKPNYNSMVIHAGVQYTLMEMINLRLGYKTGSVEGLTLGLGAHKELFENFTVGVNYAFGLVSDDFNLLHRFGIVLDF
jgi:opacity protein-like surface antigen